MRDYENEHKKMKAGETIRSLAVALSNSLNELETELDIDMYDEILDYLKEKRI